MVEKATSGQGSSLVRLQGHDIYESRLGFVFSGRQDGAALGNRFFRFLFHTTCRTVIMIEEFKCPNVP